MNIVGNLLSHFSVVSCVQLFPTSGKYYLIENNTKRLKIQRITMIHLTKQTMFNKKHFLLDETFLILAEIIDVGRILISVDL